MAAAGSNGLIGKLFLATLLGSAVTGCASVEYTSEAELSAAQTVLPLPKPEAMAGYAAEAASDATMQTAAATQGDPTADAQQQLVQAAAGDVSGITPVAAGSAQPMAASFAEMPLTAEMTAIQSVVPTPRPGTQLAFAATSSQLRALSAIDTQASPSPEAEAGRASSLNGLIAKYARLYGVPEELVHRVVHRESRYNPKAFSRGNYGLMQIRYNTARGLGYDGPPAGLFDAETNLHYAVKYLRGALLVADNNHDGAVALYSSGYYYDAKRKGMLHLLK